MFKICVIALVGLPSSGKTSFCQTVLGSPLDLNILHVCYDELFTFVPQSSNRTFKQERAMVLKQIEGIISCIKLSKRPFEGVSGWKQSQSDVFVILCDDNHYYAGMRYELFKLCRKECLAFGQVYFPLDVDIALERNRTRTVGALPPEVVRNMSERLEVPSSKNQWERNSLIMEDVIDLSVFQSFVNQCLENPLKPLDDASPPQEANVSAVHELDLLLRRRIKEYLQSASGDLSKNAKQLNDRRKTILQQTKKEPGGELDVDYYLKKLFSK